MPDGSWKGSGTCTYIYKGGDTLKDSWEEGSHLKEYTYKNTGGTGKYQKASGGGTYTLEELTHTLLGGFTLDSDELLSALRDVALLADEWDNTIADLSGGETFEMVLQDELVARLQRELVEQSWQKN